jgi:ABC-type sugar transport system substrate-binding protein
VFLEKSNKIRGGDVMNKKRIIFIVSMVLILSMVVMFMGGCAKKADPVAPKLVIGKVPILLANAYHQADVEHFKKWAEEKYGAEVVVIDGKIDSATSVAALDQLIAMNPAAISFHSIDVEAALPGILEARDAGIAIITFYTKPSQALVPHVTINEATTSFEMGVIAATKWKEFYPNTPIKIGMIEYVGVSTPIEQRSEPFIAGVKSVDPSAVVVSRLDGGGTMENAMAAAQDMIQANPDINIFYGTSSDYSIGVMAALEAAGRGKAVDGVPLTELVVGTDASESELVKIFNPNSSLKVTQGLTPKENGRLKVDTLMKIVNGELAPDANVVVEGKNIVFDFWSSSVSDVEVWMEDQYFSKVNLQELIDKQN